MNNRFAPTLPTRRSATLLVGIAAILLAAGFTPRIATAQDTSDGSDHRIRIRVRIKVLEWRLQNELDTGFTLRYLRDVDSSNNIASADSTFPSASGRDGLTAFFDRIRLGPGQVELAIQALEVDEQFRVLSEPVLTLNAKTGKNDTFTEAKFISGKEIPYETLRISNGVLLSVTEFRQTGVTLNITDAEVYQFEGDPNQRFIRMNFYVDVTRPGPEIPVGINKNDEIMTQVRALRRNLRTQLFIPENSPFIAGIIKSKIKTENASGIPYLSDIPVIGALFRSNSTKEMDTELVFLVTAEILWPDNPAIQEPQEEPEVPLPVVLNAAEENQP